MSRGRAVLLVANTADPYSRGLRVARSLAAAGWEVEIAAVSGPDVPDEERDGEIVTRRYHASGIFKRWSGLPPTPKPPTRVLKDLVRRGDRALKAWLWPLHVRGWWRTLRRELPPADLYHAFGILTVPIAVELGAKARRAGRQGIVVYDVIDAILDSNNYANVPPSLLDRYRKKEAGWVRKVDAVVTVNQALADHCERIWPFRERPTVLFNGQERWDPPAIRPDLIRDAAGLPKERAVVLYLGRLGRERGLEHAAEAVLLLADAALVMLGFPVTKGWDEQAREAAGGPAVRRPLHSAAAGPSRRGQDLGGVRRRLHHRGPRQFAEPAPLDTEQVLGEPRGRHARRPRSRPRGDARHGRGRPARLHRRSRGPRGLGTRIARDPGPAAGGLRRHAGTLPDRVP